MKFLRFILAQEVKGSINTVMAITNLSLSKIYKDIDFGFKANPASGDLSKKIDVKAVLQSVKTLIMLNYYEKPFRPEIGTGIRGLLFEPLSPVVGATLEKIIEQVIESYEPRAKKIRVISEPDYDSNTYRMTLEFYVVGIESQQKLQVELKRLR
jgi:phage baseplate assembly protein W